MASYRGKATFSHAHVALRGGECKNTTCGIYGSFCNTEGIRVSGVWEFGVITGENDMETTPKSPRTQIIGS